MFQQMEMLLNVFFWDQSTKKIEVYHEIVLGPGKGGYLESINTYSPGTDIYAEKADEYNVDTKNDPDITVYIYKENNNGPAYTRTELFPGQGGFYPLHNIEHVVIAAKIPTGTASTAQGIAF